MIRHHKPEFPVKKKLITAFRVKMLIFAHMISSNHQTFCFQIWYCGASLWVEVSCKKFDMLFSRSRSQQELIWSKNDNFYCIFWTVDSSGSKPSLMIHYEKARVSCFQGQGHSKGSECQCLSRWNLLNSQTLIRCDDRTPLGAATCIPTCQMSPRAMGPILEAHITSEHHHKLTIDL